MESLLTGTGIVRFYAARGVAGESARKRGLRYLVTHEFNTQDLEFSYEIFATGDFSEIAGNPEYLEDSYGIFDLRENRPIFKDEIAVRKKEL